MNVSPLKTALLWLGGALIVSLAYNKMGWPGVALAVGALVFWMLLLYTRMMKTLRVAANAPKGHVSNAVMLSARLSPGMTLLQVIALTHALGEEVSKEPEVWRWVDAGGSQVDCQFAKGQLTHHTLTRPTTPNEAPSN